MNVNSKKLFYTVASYLREPGIDENMFSLFVCDRNTIRQIFNQIPKTLLIISNNVVFPHGIRRHESSLLERDNTVADPVVSMLRKHSGIYKKALLMTQAPVMGIRKRFAKRKTRFLKPSRQRFNFGGIGFVPQALGLVGQNRVILIGPEAALCISQWYFFRYSSVAL